MTAQAVADVHGLSEKLWLNRSDRVGRNVQMSEPSTNQQPAPEQGLTPQQRQLQQRRRILKAAALAAPMLVTLRARSVYGQSQLGSTGMDYDPSSYLNKANNDHTNINEPGGKRRKKYFTW